MVMMLTECAGLGHRKNNKKTIDWFSNSHKKWFGYSLDMKIEKYCGIAR